MKNGPVFKWWYAVLIFLAANVISAVPAGYNGDEVFYTNFTLPAFAPPAWAFAPAWLFNNVTSLYALYVIANLPEDTKWRKYFIYLESINWVLFSIFTTVYFGLKSPILGALDTVLGLILTVLSLTLAYRMSKVAALAIVPRFLWLLLATCVSVYVAICNRDEFFQIGPFNLP